MNKYVSIAGVVLLVAQAVIGDGDVENLALNGDFRKPLAGVWHGGPYGGGPGKLEIGKDADGTCFAHLVKERGPGATQIIGQGREIGDTTRLRVSFRYRGNGLFNLSYIYHDGKSMTHVKNQMGGCAGNSESLKRTQTWTPFEKTYTVPKAARRPGAKVSLQYSVWDGELDVTDIVALPEREVAKAEVPPLNVKVVRRPDDVPYGPVEPIEKVKVDIRDGLLYRNGKACFWVGNGVDLGSSHATPAGLWLAKLLGYHAISNDPGGSLVPKLEGNELTLTGRANLARVSWAREAMRLGFLCDYFANGVYAWSPLKPIAEAHPDFKEVHYAHGHYIDTDAGHPLGRDMQREKRLAYFELIDKAKCPGIIELCREPGPEPSNARAREGFRAWAKRKYGDLATANRIWKQDFAQWEDVLPLHLQESDVTGYMERLLQLKKMETDFPEMCWDWIAYNQDDTAVICSNAFADLKADLPAQYRTIDLRGHSNQTFGYAALDPERICPLEDFHYIHYGNLPYAYNEEPYHLETLLNQTWFSLFYYSFAKNVTDRPIINSEDIVSQTWVPGSNEEAMKRNDIAQLHQAPWKFRLESEKDEGLKGKWYAPKFDDSQWDELTVPGCWDETEKFRGKTGVGWYRRRFIANAARLDWEDGSHKFYLYGRGVAQRGTIWLNGHELGKVEGWDTGYRFEVSPYLNYGGENEIVYRIDGDRYQNGIRFYAHILANDKIGESRPFTEQNYRFMLWPYMMRGTSGCWVWSWHRGPRDYWPQLVKRLEAASQVVLPDVRFKRGDIAYLYGFLNGKGLPCYTDGNHIDYLNWFDALEFSGLRADVFGERNFIEKVNPKDYPILVVPHTRMVRGETFAHFKDYVRQGGTAIITDDALTMTFERYAKTDIGEFATDCGKGRVIVVRGKPQMEELMKVLKPYLPEAKVKVEEVAGATAPAARTEPPLIERVLAGNDDRKVLYLANWGGMKHTVKVTLPEEVRGWQATLIEGNPSSVSCLPSEITLTVPSQDLVAFMLERPGAKVAPLDLEADPKVVATLKQIAELNEARPAHKGPKALFPKWSKCYGQAMGKELYPYVLDRLAAFGCHAEEEDIEMWTPELLAEYAVVVLPETNTQKLFRDKTAMDALGKKLDAYVRNGGSLLVMAYTGYTSNIYAYLLTSWIGFSPYFGVDLGTDAYDVKRGTLGDPCQTLSDAIVPGPLTEGVERVQLHYLRTIDAPKGWKVRAKPVVKIPDDCERGGGRSAMMALELGKGRVVLIADLMMFQPFRIGFADNAALLVNTAGWLLRKPVTQEMRDDFRKRGLFIERVVPSADKAGIPGDRK